ncbi:MAG: cyclic nucleotide-binding domain-containing protein, partial [Pseudomonadota bacterium]
MTVETAKDAKTIIAQMRSNPSFGPLDDRALERLARSGAIECGEKGHRFFEEGDVGDFAYLVIEGEVAIDVRSGRRDVTVATVGPGGLVGEVAAFANTPRTASVIARTETALLRIEQATIRDLLRDSPDTAMAIIAELGQRL